MKPNKFFEQKKREKQVLANQKQTTEDKYKYQEKIKKEFEAKASARIQSLKGKKNGACNRSACLSEHNVIFFNKGTRLYYCDICAKRINEFHEEDPLCKTDEGVTPRQWRFNQAQEQRKKFLEEINYDGPTEPGTGTEV